MMKDYSEKILAYLNQATEPVDVEKIRIACGIGHWNTALKHCLSLLVKNRIQGQETTKGWIFWVYQKQYLEPWEEAIGTLERIEPNQTETTAILICTIQKRIAIALPKTNQLNKLIGKKIGILKTDDRKKPYTIRLMESHKNDYRNPSIAKHKFTVTGVSQNDILAGAFGSLSCAVFSSLKSVLRFTL
jgi:hypothetical protein